MRFYSGYFDAALNGRFKEGNENIVRLTSEDTQVFELFVNYIHTRHFYESTLAPSQLLSFEILARMWVFGDAHDVPLLQNAVVDIWKIKASDNRVTQAEAKIFPGEDTIDYVFENTMPGATLQELLIDLVGIVIEVPWTRHVKSMNFYPEMGRAWYVEGSTDLHDVLRKHDLMRPLMVQFSRYPVCHWHVHESGVNCFTDDTEARYEDSGSA